MTDAVGDGRVPDLVVEVDARRAPHHDLVGLVPLEELERAVRHPAAGRRVALLVMDDAAAIRRAADGDVVETEPVEDGGDGADHVRGPQHVAAEVQHDRLAPRPGLGGRQAPAPLVRARGEVVEQPDLAEILAVVEAHRVSWCDSRLQ